MTPARPEEAAAMRVVVVATIGADKPAEHQLLCIKAMLAANKKGRRIAAGVAGLYDSCFVNGSGSKIV